MGCALWVKCTALGPFWLLGSHLNGGSTIAPTVLAVRNISNGFGMLDDPDDKVHPVVHSQRVITGFAIHKSTKDIAT